MSVVPKEPVIVVGGQFGSEAKGSICAYLAGRLPVDIMVRTGSVNAGHTVYYQDREYKMQQLPVGWVNPRTQLILGPGTMIYHEILRREVAGVERDAKLFVANRVKIDHRVGWHGPEHTARSSESGRHHKMGATGKGCSEALMDKMANRGGGYKLYIDREESAVWRPDAFIDAPTYLSDAIQSGQRVLLEGTQGAHLDLHLGPYPYTTHKMTNAAQWVAEAGLSPSLPWMIIMVVRTYPIRVAGNSGPMPGEIDWPELAATINRKLTLLGKQPRVQVESLVLFQKALRAAATKSYPQLAEDGLDPVHQSRWSAIDRVKHKEAVSELNKLALENLAVEHPAVLIDLCRLFEMTTVTRKLRRVARLDTKMVREAIVWNRPRYLALTFLNYEFPDLWNETDANRVWGDKRVKNYVAWVEGEVGVQVRWVTTGAHNSHVLEDPASSLRASGGSLMDTGYQSVPAMEGEA